MSRFSELRAFIEVVEAGSITHAAERLEIAKSAVSRRLAELESRLGVQLLLRTTRRLTLTDSGRSLYERGAQILRDLDEVELSVSQQHCELAGRLRVAAPQSFGHRHLAPAIHDFAARHPEIRFDLDLSDRQVDLIEEGFDLAIRIADLEDSSLIARKIASTTHVVCASESYLAQKGMPQTPLDLLDHRCLVYGHAPSPGTWRFRIRGGAWEKVVVPIHMRASSGDFLAAAAAAGLGIVMEPDFIVHEALERVELRPLLTDYQWPSLGIYALYPPTRFLSRRVRDFIDFLTARFGDEPYWQL